MTGRASIRIRTQRQVKSHLEELEDDAGMKFVLPISSDGIKHNGGESRNLSTNQTLNSEEELQILGEYLLAICTKLFGFGVKNDDATP